MDIRSADDWASLLLLVMIVYSLFLLSTPIGNAFSRYQEEHEADRYGLKVIHGIVDDPGEVAAHEVEGEIDLQDPLLLPSSSFGCTTTQQ